MIRTVETHSAPTHGPTRTTARVPPSRWPETPGSTWKLSICTAKMNAATRPAIGASRSSRSARARPGGEPVVGVGAGPPHAEGQGKRGEDCEDRGHRAVHDPVGDVHRFYL